MEQKGTGFGGEIKSEKLKKTEGIHPNWTGITNPVLNPDFQR